jgi:hypothetical protein
MIKQEMGFSPANREWMGWPIDLRQRAVEVIATTRYAWVSRGAADEPVADRARFAHPLSRLAPDASPEP